MSINNSIYIDSIMLGLSIGVYLRNKNNNKKKKVKNNRVTTKYHSQQR